MTQVAYGVGGDGRGQPSRHVRLKTDVNPTQAQS